MGRLGKLKNKYPLIKDVRGKGCDRMELDRDGKGVGHGMHEKVPDSTARMRRLTFLPPLSLSGGDRQFGRCAG